jgi:polysaccharide pyruvyl transferase WcaK-like protein
MNAKLIKSIEIPIVLYGVGHIQNLEDVGLTDAQTESIRLLNTCTELISVRDELTHRFLKDLGTNDVHVIGDPAIFLASRETSQPALDENKIKIGVNLACHGWTLHSQYLDRTIEEYIKICKFLIKQLNAEIVYLKHHPHEGRAIESLKKKLSVKVADTSSDPYEMKFIYGELDLVIGMMMHSAVLAFGSGTPVISVAYDIKNYAFMEFIGQRDRVVDVRKLDFGKIGDLAMFTLEDSKNIKKNFGALKRELSGRQENFLAKINRLS